jgi:hypothetical protein
MGGWSNDNRDTIEWDGYIKARGFIGAAVGSFDVDTIVCLDGSVLTLNNNVLTLQ